MLCAQFAKSWLTNRISQTFTFLIAFPPKDWALDRVKSHDNFAKDLFPFEQPYVAFYMLHTLIHCIDDEASEVRSDFRFSESEL